MSVSTKSKGLPGTQVAKTAEFVSYQDGAVVSREIVRKPSGSMTLFAFDAGEGLSEHTAPFDALVQVLAPIQERRASYTEAQVAEILEDGSSRARARAELTMVEVRAAMQIGPQETDKN